MTKIDTVCSLMQFRRFLWLSCENRMPEAYRKDYSAFPEYSGKVVIEAVDKETVERDGGREIVRAFGVAMIYYMSHSRGTYLTWRDTAPSRICGVVSGNAMSHLVRSGIVPTAKHVDLSVSRQRRRHLNGTARTQRQQGR